MKNSKILIYDGSFNGFLTAIFNIFEGKIQVSDIQKNKEIQKGLFSETLTIFTQMDKARRVWNSIQNKSNIAMKAIYFAFLSEARDIELSLYQYIRSMYTDPNKDPIDVIAEIGLKIEQHSRMVAREKHRIEALVRFKISKDGIYFSDVAPSYDVLPLISKYFRTKYKDREFIIYDTKRRYALYHNLNTVEIISLEPTTYPLHEDISQVTLKQLITNKLYSQHAKEPQTAYLSEKTAV